MASPPKAPGSQKATGEVEGLAIVLDQGLFGKKAEERYDLLRKNLGAPEKSQALKSIGQQLHDGQIKLKDALRSYADASDESRWPVVTLRPNGAQERVEDRILGLGLEIVPSLASAYRRVGLIPLRLPPEFAFLETLSRRPDISRIERSWAGTSPPDADKGGNTGLSFPDELLSGEDMAQHLLGRRDPVRIGLLDSGIDARHPVLQKRLIDQRAFRRGEERVGDRFGHGTAMAGLIAKMCPSAHFLSAKVISEQGHGNLDDAIRALGWLRRLRPDIILCSLQMTMKAQGRAILTGLLADLARDGTLVIVPAQNPAGDIGCPAEAQGVVSVAMTRASQGQRATLRARGSKLRVPRSIQGDKERFPMMQPNGWTSFEGPAISAAVVAGTAALLIRQAWRARVPVDGHDITQALLRGCPDNGPRVLDPRLALTRHEESLAEARAASDEAPRTNPENSQGTPPPDEATQLDVPAIFAANPTSIANAVSGAPASLTPEDAPTLIASSDQEPPTIAMDSPAASTSGVYVQPGALSESDGWDAPRSSSDNDSAALIEGGWILDDENT